MTRLVPPVAALLAAAMFGFSFASAAGGAPLPASFTSIAAGVVGASATTGKSGGAARSQTIYFFGAPYDVIDKHNPLVVRPSGLLMVPDGHWYLSGLHWRGWGSGVGHATGVSNASNCNPSCAGGSWSRVPVQVTLSNPGRFQGHEVYRCYRVMSRGLPPSGEGGCLTRVGSVWLLAAHKASSTPTTTARTPKQEAIMLTAYSACHMSDDGSFGGSWVYCWIGGSTHPARHVKLNVDGQFSLTATTAIPLGLGGPAAPYGTQVTAGRFRCQSLRSGIKCTVISSGKGFLFNANGARRVGP